MKLNRRYLNFIFYLVIASLPLLSVQITFLSVSPTTLLVVIFSFLLIIDVFLSAFKINQKNFFYVFIVFSYFFIMLVRTDIYFNDNSVILSYFIKFLSFSSVFVYFNFQEHSNTLYKLFAFNLLIVCLGFLLIQFGYIDPVRTQNARIGYDEYRTTGILSNFGDISIIGSIVFVFILFPKLFPNKFFYFLFSLITILEILVVLFYSQSRNLILTIIVSVLFKLFLLVLKIKNLYIKFILFVLIILSGSVSVLYIPFEDVSNSEFFETGRFDQYSRALKLFTDNPIFGTGFGYYQSFYNSDWDVHNLFLNSLQNTGLVGFIILCSITIIPFLSFIKFFINRRYISNQNLYPLEYYLVCFLIVIFSVQFYPGHNSIVFWSYLGIFTSNALNLKNVN